MKQKPTNPHHNITRHNIQTKKPKHQVTHFQQHLQQSDTHKQNKHTQQTQLHTKPTKQHIPHNKLTTPQTDAISIPT